MKIGYRGVGVMKAKKEEEILFGMKPVFHSNAVNSPFGDPVLFVRILRERQALLFDSGDISGLSAGDLMKLTDVFVTHMHIDHFIGFDTIIRALLKRETPVTFYGPFGILDKITTKLKGYTWNLVSEYPLVVHVFEIRNKNVRTATFSACNRFEPRDQDEHTHHESVLDTPLFSVRAVDLEHDIPSLGFSLKEKVHINIDKTKLLHFGLQVGPWLNRLKGYIREGLFDAEIDTGSGCHRLSDLKDIYTITEGQKVSYIVDSSPTKENIEEITQFVADSDALYIEAHFLHEDIEHARRRHHLTARIAGEIARNARVRSLHLLHFSSRYRTREKEVIAEAFKWYL
jgi:ribonuclease Z